MFITVKQQENKMGASDVTVTKQQIHVHLYAMLTQLSASGIANNFDSVADALEKLDMWDFLFNQASVTAHLHAFGTRDANTIRDLIHNR
jgi:hypothetical protein